MNSRREKARLIGLVVSERIREVTTPGLGLWDTAWALVAEPSDHFMDRLHEWEQDGARGSLVAVELAAEALVAAWREADKKFRESLRTETLEALTHAPARGPSADLATGGVNGTPR